MKPEILTCNAEGMDFAQVKGVIDEVRIRFRGKVYVMGFISFLRLQQEFEREQKSGKNLDLRGLDKHYVVREVTIDEIERTVIACEKDGSLEYYLEVP